MFFSWFHSVQKVWFNHFLKKIFEKKLVFFYSRKFPWKKKLKKLEKNLWKNTTFFSSKSFQEKKAGTELSSWNPSKRVVAEPCSAIGSIFSKWERCRQPKWKKVWKKFWIFVHVTWLILQYCAGKSVSVDVAVEYAKSSKSTCNGCFVKIEKSSLRIG